MDLSFEMSEGCLCWFIFLPHFIQVGDLLLKSITELQLKFARPSSRVLIVAHGSEWVTLKDNFYSLYIISVCIFDAYLLSASYSVGRLLWSRHLATPHNATTWYNNSKSQTTFCHVSRQLLKKHSLAKEGPMSRAGLMWGKWDPYLGHTILMGTKTWVIKINNILMYYLKKSKLVQYILDE